MKINSIKSVSNKTPFKSNAVFTTFETNNNVSQNKKSFQNNDEFSKTKDETNKYKLPMLLGAIAGITAITFGIIKAVRKPEVISTEPEKVLHYAETLAEGLSKMIGRKVDPKQLACVADKKELMEVLPKLTEQNYIYNFQNTINGVFKADLHSHSTFSNGYGDVKKLLDQVAEYGNQLFKSTKGKEKFYFALTDHDGVDGIKKALEIIAKNPEKYKNIRFVPGVELSFAHAVDKSTNPTETSELLAYCIDPFSKGLTDFLTNIHLKRENMIKGFLNDLTKKFPKTKFSLNELERIYDLKLPKETYEANIHWKLNHYGQTKTAITQLAKEKRENAQRLYSKIMSNSDDCKSLDNLKNSNIIPSDFEENEEIINLRKKYQPQIDSSGNITASGENTIDEIFDTMSKEKDIFMAFAHPLYLTKKLHNPQRYIQDVLKKSNGLIQATETYHQGYSSNISKDTIFEANNQFENLNLIKIGGRNNHNAKIL